MKNSCAMGNWTFSKDVFKIIFEICFLKSRKARKPFYLALTQTFEIRKSVSL